MSPPSPTLKEMRLALNLRQEDVAKRAGCSISCVSMTESGYRPGTQVREAIARTVGASLGSFWPAGAP
jgi:transcriptional regulator with XRE-family HTH domain